MFIATLQTHFAKLSQVPSSRAVYAEGVNSNYDTDILQTIITNVPHGDVTGIKSISKQVRR